jgi:hypothetical protein
MSFSPTWRARGRRRRGRQGGDEVEAVREIEGGKRELTTDDAGCVKGEKRGGLQCAKSGPGSGWN